MQRLARLERVSPSTHETYLCGAAVYDALGDSTEAFRSLRRGVELGATLHGVDQTPLSKALRNDPRYSRLIADHDLEETDIESRAGDDPATPRDCPQSTVAGLSLTNSPS